MAAGLTGMIFSSVVIFRIEKQSSGQ